MERSALLSWSFVLHLVEWRCVGVISRHCHSMPHLTALNGQMLTKHEHNEIWTASVRYALDKRCVCTYTCRYIVDTRHRYIRRCTARKWLPSILTFVTVETFKLTHTHTHTRHICSSSLIAEPAACKNYVYVYVYVYVHRKLKLCLPFATAKKLS